MELEDKVQNNDIGDVPLEINWATVTTDWGTLLDLPVGISTAVGYDGMGTGDAIGASGWGLECYGGLWLDKEGAGQINVTLADMVTVTAIDSFDFDIAGEDETEMILGATLDMAPLPVVAACDLRGDGMSLSTAGSFAYDLTEDVAEGSELLYGFGADSVLPVLPSV